MESVAVLDQDIKRAFSNKEVVVSIFWILRKHMIICGRRD